MAGLGAGRCGDQLVQRLDLFERRGPGGGTLFPNQHRADLDRRFEFPTPSLGLLGDLRSQPGLADAVVDVVGGLGFGDDEQIMIGGQCRRNDVLAIGNFDHQAHEGGRRVGFLAELGDLPLGHGGGRAELGDIRRGHDREVVGDKPDQAGFLRDGQHLGVLGGRQGGDVRGVGGHQTCAEGGEDELHDAFHVTFPNPVWGILPITKYHSMMAATKHPTHVGSLIAFSLTINCDTQQF